MKSTVWFVASLFPVIALTISSPLVRGGEVICEDKAPTVLDCSPSPWKFEISLPAWAAWTEGTISSDDVSASGSYGFDEAIDDLDYAPVALAMAVKHCRVGYRFEFSKMSVSPGRTFEDRRFLDSVVVETEQTRVNQHILFDVIQNDCLTVSLGGGIRYFGMDSTLRVVSAGGRFGFVRSSEVDLWDAVFAGEARYCLSDKAFLRVLGDYGGTDSDSTWQVIAGGGYYINPCVYLSLDYRQLEQQFSGPRATVDLIYKGPQMGLNMVF